MSGWLVLAGIAGIPTLTALIVYAAERNLRQFEERARQSHAVWRTPRKGSRR